MVESPLHRLQKGSGYRLRLLTYGGKPVPQVAIGFSKTNETTDGIDSFCVVRVFSGKVRTKKGKLREHTYLSFPPCRSAHSGEKSCTTLPLAIVNSTGYSPVVESPVHGSKTKAGSLICPMRYSRCTAQFTILSRKLAHSMSHSIQPFATQSDHQKLIPTRTQGFEASRVRGSEAPRLRGSEAPRPRGSAGWWRSLGIDGYLVYTNTANVANSLHESWNSYSRATLKQMMYSSRLAAITRTLTTTRASEASNSSGYELIHGNVTA